MSLQMSNTSSKMIEQIDHLQFSIFKNDDVLTHSVIEITQPTLGGSNSVYAPELGVIEDRKECITCGEDFWTCPGHFGHITLHAPIPHPFYRHRISKFCNIFCKNKLCNRLLIKVADLNIMDLKKKKLEKRLDEIHDLCSKIDECPHCEEPNGQVKYCNKDTKFFITYGNKETKFPFTYKEIDVLFNNIREKDLKIIGFKNTYHPKDMLIKHFPVSPPSIRPYVSFNGSIAHDDITYKYIEIVKTNNKLKDMKNEKKEMDLVESLDFHISTIMDNTKKKVRDNNKRIIKCINSRISGKKGHIRKNICGKRCDFNARTVIGPEVNCKVDEMIVPIQVADKLTVPITVNKLNMNYCKQLIEEGRVNVIKSMRTIAGKEKEIVFNMKYAAFEVKGTEIMENDKVLRTKDGKAQIYDVDKCITAKGKFELMEGDKIWRNKQWIDVVMPKKRQFNLKEGDIVERKLQNGDWVLLNRQPSLRADSMRAKKIRILPGKTFRFNLASTEAFNADPNYIIYRMVGNRRIEKIVIS